MALIIHCVMITIVVFSVLYIHSLMKCDDVTDLPKSDKVIGLIAFMVLFFWIIFSSALAVFVLLT